MLDLIIVSFILFCPYIIFKFYSSMAVCGGTVGLLLKIVPVKEAIVY